MIGAFSKKKYRLRPVPSSSRPCAGCAAISPAGEFVGPAAERATLRSAAAPKPRKGVKLRFEATAPGDLAFAFKGPLQSKRKAKPRGSFVYAATDGANAPKFTGVIAPHKPLSYGTYKVKVTSADGAKAGTFKVAVVRRR